MGVDLEAGYIATCNPLIALAERIYNAANDKKTSWNCRNTTGTFLGANFIHLPNVTSSLMVEALAIRGAMEFACLNQWRKVEIESNSKYLIQVINGRQHTPMEVEI
ncbi:hypothetical protein LIER_06974 [Lithospermum erythrorhizon]|uniref:RNase H type-1 domain-containing protein n=1 Tax=Lithospermum erythrorhizon TaxID=34254 RepID=A0AAV3P8B2_LITER